MRNYQKLTIVAAVTTIVFSTVSVCIADAAIADDKDEEIVDDVDGNDNGNNVDGNDVVNRTERWTPFTNWWSMPKWAKPYTYLRTGCPCWWDLTLGDVCACCKNHGWRPGEPCGYPLHNFCQQKRWNNPRGCPGLIPNGRRRNKIQYERYTLSTKGYPCHYDKTKKHDHSCAWCVPGAQQCGQAKTWANRILDHNWRMKWYWKWENTCLPVLNGDRKGYAKRAWANCIGEAQDCRKKNSECDINADCLDTGYWKGIRAGKWWSITRCACKPGFVGNGITCANAQTGLVTRPGVKVTTKVTTDVWEQYKLDPNIDVSNNDDFMTHLDKLLAGGNCAGGCNNDVVTCPA